MTIHQEYDTECATMTFGEEDIDWKVMNIKMTIDKTGNQHPSWIYTPLYTKDILTPNLDSPEEQRDSTRILRLSVQCNVIGQWALHQRPAARNPHAASYSVQTKKEHHRTARKNFICI